MRDARLEKLLREDCDSGERSVLEVAQLWGDSLLGIAHFARPQRVTIGDREECDFAAPARRLRAHTFPIVVTHRGESFLQFDESFGGAIEEGGNARSLAELIADGSAMEARDGDVDLYRMPLAADTRAHLDLGPISFLVQRVPRSQTVRTELSERLDAGFLAVLGIVLALALGGTLSVWILGMLGVLHAGPDERAREQVRAIANIALPPLPPPPPRRRPAATSLAHAPSAPKGNPHAGSGSTGSGATGKSAHAKITSMANVDPDGGVLAVLHAQKRAIATAFGGGASLDEVLGPHGQVVGIADQNGAGTGIRGDGPGAGGHSIPVGWGDHGHAPGGGYGPGTGPGSFGDPKGKRDARIGVLSEEMVEVGVLDPTLIDAVIRKHIPQIRWCYERALPAKPELEGKLVVHFVIEADGRVSSAAMKSSTIGDAEVESCVADRFHALRFPRPAGDGTVTVNYPVVFRTTGG